MRIYYGQDFGYIMRFRDEAILCRVFWKGNDTCVTSVLLDIESQA